MTCLCVTCIESPTYNLIKVDLFDALESDLMLFVAQDYDKYKYDYYLKRYITHYQYVHSTQNDQT